jgi:hypothetical protein
MSNKTKNLQDNYLPAVFNARQNANWKALIEAIGEGDQAIADLIEEVKNEIFIKTSSDKYLERNASNVGVSKPEGIDISDENFREYIPIMSYMPKQIKQTIEKLIKLYFTEENTNAYVESTLYEPFNLFDGATISFKVDNENEDLITFNTDDFTNINAATAEEIVSIINRNSEYAFANVYYNNLEGKNYIRIFTKTTGKQGFIEITGGTSNTFIQFEGFNANAGNGTDTQWNITKVGDLMKYKYIGNTSPNLYKVQKDDIIISLITGNEGSFVIEEVDLSDQSIYFRNSNGTEIATHTQTSANEVKFITPYRSNAYKRLSRALLWEADANTFTIETPSSTSILDSTLEGAAHINGLSTTIDSFPSATTIEINDATDWESSGNFLIKFLIKNPNQYVDSSGTLQEDPIYYKDALMYKNIIYSYNGILGGNVLQNVFPAMPDEAESLNFAIASGARTAGVSTITLSAAPTGLQIGDMIGVSGTGNLDGTFEITNILAAPDRIVFTDYRPNDTVGAGGYVLKDIPGIHTSGHTIYQYSASTTGTFLGSYIYDIASPYVVKSNNDTLNQNINIGYNTKTISILGTGNLPETEEGYLIFGFGTENEEGPVKYYYISNNLIFIDPAYFFTKQHLSGDSIYLCENILQETSSISYSPHIIDPSIAMDSFVDAVKELKATGIKLDFIIRYPNNFYNGFDIY